jgi:hypothetical protein
MEKYSRREPIRRALLKASTDTIMDRQTSHLTDEQFYAKVRLNVREITILLDSVAPLPQNQDLEERKEPAQTDPNRV